MFYYLINSELNQSSAAFRIGGPDANTYLQGQFTQDLNRSIGSAGYGLFLNQKGKVVADGYILRLGDNDFRLVSFSLEALKLRERLEVYLIADEVSIADETEKWVRVSVWGDGVGGGVVTKLIGQAPESGAWGEGRGIIAFRGRCSAEDNFELLIPITEVNRIAEELRAKGGIEADVGQAERTRIESGIPLVPVDIGLIDLPNEGGLEEVAISYTKGCYLGQEVMARLKNLGQVRRRLHVVRGAGVTPASGAPLFQGENKVGEVRSVARDGGGFVAMAMLSLVNLSSTNGLSLTPNGEANINLTRRV